MKVNLDNLSVAKSGTFLAYLLLATGAMVNAGSAKALEFDLNYTGSDPAALAAFQEAADIWESQLTDDITVRLEVGYSPLGSNVLGQNQSETIGGSYTNVENALIDDQTSSYDATATANLPGFTAGASKAFTFVGTEDDGSLESIDGYNSGTNTFTPTGDNRTLDISRANAKALGLLDADDIANDATITFSSNFNFDLDRSNGIDPNKFDFVGVAVHEIGHALGFSSGVDFVDANVAGELGQTYNLDGFRVFNVLDLYRHSDLSAAISQDFGQTVLDLSVEGKEGGDVISYDGTDYDAEPYLSIDGGMNPLMTDGEEGLFSTGSYLGDGNQASHWKDDLGIGILDPTIAIGTQGDLTNSDLRAFDIIGYNSASASVPFEFSPSFGIFLVSGMYGFRKLKKRQANL